MEYSFTEHLNNPFAAPWARAEINDDLEAHIIPLTFGRARICLTSKDPGIYRDGW